MIDPSSSEEEDDENVQQHHAPQRSRNEPPGYLEVPNATPRYCILLNTFKAEFSLECVITNFNIDETHTHFAALTRHNSSFL